MNEHSCFDLIEGMIKVNETQKKLPDQEVAYNYFKSEIKGNTDYTGMDEDQAFELFSARLVLKSFSPTYAEIENGLVGGSEDGGIDSLYAVINNQVLDQGDLGDIVPKVLHKKTPLDLYFIQSKNTLSWKADVWPKMHSSITLLLNSSLEKKDLQKLAESGLSEELQRFSINLRNTREQLSNIMPVIRLHCIYASFGLQKCLPKLIRSRGTQLESDLKGMLPTDSSVSVEYWDSLQIQKIGAQSTNYNATLKIFDQAIIENEYSENDDITGKGRIRAKNFVALVTLEEYLNFIRKPLDYSDESNSDSEVGKINTEMFESNVRDYAGNTDVNRAILNTLKNDSNTRFWWLNNGITILADETYDENKSEWVIENPLIVNGLQTSFALFNAFQKNAITQKRLKECLLVRVITSKDEVIRQDIITGTNKQNSIPKTQLHANDSLQIRIEQYLKGYKWYYERRKYQYRSSETPLSRIRTITELSQAVMAYKLLVPDQARARPTTFLNKDGGKGWELVFPTKDEDLTLYKKALEVQNKVDTFLKTPEAKKISSDSLNARYYLTSCYSLLSSDVNDKEQFKDIPVRDLKDDPSDELLEGVLQKFVEVSEEFDFAMQKNDQLYKSSDFRDRLFEEVLKDKQKLN